jgi:hypothetical protein
MLSLCIAFWMTSLPICYEMQTVSFAFSRLYYWVPMYADQPPNQRFLQIQNYTVTISMLQ